MNKTCCRCRQSKELFDFPKSKGSSFGVHSICKACKAQYMLEYRKSGKLKLSKDKYRTSSKGKAKIRSYTASDANKTVQKAYLIRVGRGPARQRLANYRAKKFNASPIWNQADQLRDIYNKCPKGMQVDHIIPIQSDQVSGLHVPWNLQYLSAYENKLKSNYFDGTMDNNSWRMR